MNSAEFRPKLSVVVVCYEMAPQIANTFRSLLLPYQQNVATSDDVGTVAAKMTSPKNKVREKCTTNEK
jgi:hypothetical protein